MGDDSQQRYKNYQKIFDKLGIAKEESLITEATMRGEVYGTNGSIKRSVSWFHDQLSWLLMGAIEKVRLIKIELAGPLIYLVF